MKANIKTIKTSLTFICSAILLITLSACSDDEQTTKEHNYFDHGHGADVTDLEKHKFEHDFAKQCVERETRNSNNKAYDKKRFEKPCLCIATFMMKDLTAIEAEKFLEEQKNTQSLRIRFENAAYHCIQEKSDLGNQAPIIFQQR